MARKPHRKNKTRRRAKPPPAPKQVSLTGHAGLLAAFLLAPVACRVALLLEGDVRLGAADLRGFLSDLVVSLFLTTAIGFSLRWTRWVAPPVVLLWSICNYGNYEHVKALDALAGVAHAAFLTDTTFVGGSALAVSNPLLLLAVVLGSVAAAWSAAVQAGGRFRWGTLGIIALVSWGAHWLWPRDVQALGWRQANVLYENLRWQFEPSPLTQAEWEPREAEGDLSGTPILELGHHRHNVLLIMLEGVSGGFLDEVAAAHGVNARTKLPRLNRIASQNLIYRTFVSQQRQTNRGEYAILCGDYPKLVTAAPKMSEYVMHGGIECLPSVLNRSGYRTVYLQAAPLPFMLKDQFMKLIGYSGVHGDEWFPKAYARSQWGVDDRAFFEQGLRMVEQLEQDGTPWFLSMLTVGTHHPFNVPAGFKSFRYPSRSLGWAMDYLDEATAQFLRRLGETGVLDKTLVLLTSDESAGTQDVSDDLTKMLSQNWSFLLALVPGQGHKKLDEPFMQIDLPISILDYLGLKDEAKAFTGRSVFRHYDTTRPIAFANTYSRMIGALHQDRFLYLCQERFTSCQKYELVDKRLFSPQRVEVPLERTEVAFLREISLESQRGRTPAPTIREFQLLANPLVPVIDLPKHQFVFGGQFLAIQAGTRVEVDLEVVVRGDEGVVKLKHDLIGRRTRIYRREIPGMMPGDRLVIRYAYDSPTPLDRMECRFWVEKHEGRNLVLSFDKARMRLVPLPPGKVSARRGGLEEVEFSVERGLDG
jgi:arylsulfatase A-like enzyme